MSNLVNETMEFDDSPKSSFQLATEGVHEARINSIIELGYHVQIDPKTGNKKKPEAMVRIVYEVFEEDETSALVTKDYTITFGDRSNFPIVLNAALGTTMSPDEVKNYFRTNPVRDLIGKEVQLKIKHNKSGEKTFANVDGPVMGLTPKARSHVPVAIKESVVFLKNADDAVEVFKTKLTMSARKKIMEANNADNYSTALKEAWLEIQMNTESQPEEVRAETRHAVLG